jgi:hypothetical protein
VGAAIALGEDDEAVPASGDTDAYDVAWARRVLDEAVQRMRAECAASGREDVWGMFECRVLGPVAEGTEPADYEELVRRFGFQSPSQASNALVTAKRMVARSLRSVVAEYTRDAAEVEAEIQDLHRILANAK